MTDEFALDLIYKYKYIYIYNTFNLLLQETSQHGRSHKQPEPVLYYEKKLDSDKLNEENLAVNPLSGSHACII